ncbi:MerR family transcriptional regulator [Maritimibacter sp. UBA3975]|uniref:MerR family transcriptional regulator n=1 Tax=Maritimibacter sp. UBA3975 TaxID=1946833 RepID=UPI0025B7C097|nr:MerR family transcriptional regulator [Maritimibacter sp. UBA3975]|tara:strand:+ start:44046 stop:45557 length:1512 start_codon:yes stop_codon:yes gene_type:complete
MEQKSPDAFRTISEVAEWLGVPTHVLRFWESRFTQVKPVKRAGGRRYYRPSDMELLGGIRKLLHEDGMTIRGVQKLLREEGVKHVAAMSPPLDLEGGDADSNVVSLDQGRRASGSDVEEAELVEDTSETVEDALAPAVDEAMESGELAPVDPEEDRSVTFGTEEPAAEEVEAHAPHLSDETLTPAESDPSDDIEATPGEDPLAAETAADPEGVEAPLDPPAPDSPPEHSPFGTWAKDDTPAPGAIAAADLPSEDDPVADETLASEDQTDEAARPPEPGGSDVPTWDTAVEVSGSDDSDILPEPEAPAPETESPHISRADPTPEMHEHPEPDEVATSEPEDSANVFSQDAPSADWEMPVADPSPDETIEASQPSAQEYSEPDPAPDWQPPIPDEPATPEDDTTPVAAPYESETRPAEDEIASEQSDDPFEAAPEPSDNYDSPVLIMPDLPDDPADGTLPPDIAPVAPRLRMLRAHQATLPSATLQALADRLATLRSEHDGTTLR